MSGFNSLQAAAYDAAARQRQRSQFQGMSAYERHKKMVRDLAVYYGRRMGGAEGAEGPPMKTDYDILRDAYRFIRTEADDAGDSWEVRLARRYYAKLFREYAVADLSRHKEGRLGLRWRTQREVVAGKGQFVCGAVGCDERRGLASFEVPFAYQEAGERKQALVKARLCPAHAYQLNYRKHKEAEEAHKRRERKQAKRAKRRRRDRRGKGGGSDASSDSSGSCDDESRSEEEEEGGGLRSGRRKRRSRGSEGGAEGAERGPPQARGSTAAAAAGKLAGAGGGGGEGSAARAGGHQGQDGDEFEVFFHGLFE